MVRVTLTAVSQTELFSCLSSLSTFAWLDGGRYDFRISPAHVKKSSGSAQTAAVGRQLKHVGSWLDATVCYVFSCNVMRPHKSLRMTRQTTKGYVLHHSAALSFILYKIKPRYRFTFYSPVKLLSEDEHFFGDEKRALNSQILFTTDLNITANMTKKDKYAES